ncbi:MFS transporter [Sutcliffiella horikoshii]|uniref:MFS transporter n=1 Tax=Sutcliffiella horikoshii TaxID=79883 RepID=UPI001CC09DD0|nr:MFS transporter [Sutcliffiella horikoshii]UAL45648.1 MFS transporter [Sutcliffiella horikoshii]
MRRESENISIISITSTSFILVLGNSMLIPVLPEIRHDLQLTQVQASLILSIFSIAGAVTIPFIGYLSDRFSRKHIILASLLLYGIGGLVSGTASILQTSFSFEGIIFGRVLQGIGSAGTAPIAMAIVADLFSGSKQLKVLSLMETTNSLGKVVSPLIGAFIALIMWHYIFFVFPLACSILFILFILYVKNEESPSEKLIFKDYARHLAGVMKDNKFYLLTSYSAGALCLFLLFGILFYSSDLLESQFETHGFMNGVILSFPLLFLTVASFLTGNVIGKFSNYINRILIVNFLLLSVFLLGILLYDSLWWTILFISLISTSIGIILPCMNAIITNSVKKEARGFVTALYGSVRFVGIALGPMVFGYFMDFSIPTIFVLSSLLCLLQAILCFFYLDKTNKSISFHAIINRFSIFHFPFQRKKQRG